MSSERLEEIDKELEDIKRDIFSSQNCQSENEDLNNDSDEDSSSDIMSEYINLLNVKLKANCAFEACDARLLSEIERNQLKKQLLEKIKKLKRKLSTMNYLNSETTTTYPNDKLLLFLMTFIK